MTFKEKIKDIFSRQGEKMSRNVHWFFGLPLSFVVYIAFSLFVPSFGSSLNAQTARRIVLYIMIISSILITVHSFLKFSIKKLFFGKRKFSLKFFLIAFFTMFNACMAIQLAEISLHPENFSFIMDGSPFVLNWILTFIMIVVAALCEELIFRAYIAYFLHDSIESEAKKQIVYCIISAFFFSLAHFSNPEAKQYALISFSFYFIMGFALMASYFSYGGIEVSLGIHIANNIVPALFFTYPSSVLQTKAMFVQYNGLSTITVVESVICIVTTMLICRFVLLSKNAKISESEEK